MKVKTLHLHPAKWRAGDRIMHRDGGRVRREAGLSPLVTVTAVRATNEAKTRWRVEWETAEGETGVDYVAGRGGYVVTRAAPDNDHFAE